MSRRTALEGRWCEAQVWQAGQQFGRCGGELRHARRVEGEQIVTYLYCLFCAAKTPILTYDMETGEHRSLIDA